jgi:hypothetical protein
MRLEIVKLCHRHDLEPERIIERAKSIEAYVLEPEANAPRGGRKPRSVVQAGNSDEVL